VLACHGNSSPVYSHQHDTVECLEDSYNKTNEMHKFLKFIFGIEFYMLRTGFLYIIRSLVLYDIYLLLCVCAVLDS